MRRTLACLAAMTIAACAESSTADVDAAAADAAADAVVSSDAGLDAGGDSATDLPACMPLSPTRLQSDEPILLPLHSPLAEPFLLGIATDPTGTRVLWQEVDSERAFVVRGAVVGDGSTDVWPLADLPTAAQVDGDAVAEGDGKFSFAWTSVSIRSPSLVDWVLRSESSTGLGTAVRVASTAVPTGFGIFDIGPALAVLNDAPTLLWVGANEGLTIAVRPEVEPVSEGRPTSGYGRVIAHVVTPARSVVVWSEIGTDGFARAMIASVSEGRISQPPRAVMTGLSGAAAMIVAPDAIWIAGFTRTPTALRASRARILRLDREDLSALGPEGAIGGWGGGLPVGLTLVYWRDDVWAVWLADDIRFGDLQSLFVWRVPTDACLASDVAPLRLLDDTLRGADTSFSVRAAASGEELWVGLQGRPGSHGASVLRIRPE